MVASSPRTLRALVLASSAALGLILWFGVPPADILDIASGPGSGDAEAVYGSEHSVSQTFRPQADTLTAIEVAVAPSPVEDTRLQFVLFRVGDRSPLREVGGTLADLRSADDLVRFTFAPLTGVRGVDLIFTLRAPAATPEQPIQTRYDIDNRSYAAGHRLVNDRLRPGDLAFSAWRHGTPGESWRLRILTGRAGQGIAAFVIGILTLLLLIDWRADVSRTHSTRTAILLSLLLALVYTFPITARLGLWAADESDWAEATSTVSATRATLAAGQFPEWNPYMCGGTPNIANPQTYLLPVALPLSFIVGDVVAIKLEFIVLICLGLLGMLKLAHTLGIRGAPAVLMSAVYMLSGFSTAHLANGQALWLTLAWVPWVVYAFWKSLTGTLWWTVVAAAFLVLIFVEGRVYLVAYTALLLVALAVTMTVRDRRVRPLRALAAVGILTLSLGAWKLLPTLSFLADTERSLPNTPGLSLTAVDDAFLHRDLTRNIAETSNDETLPRHELTAYVGVLPLFLALVSLRRRTRWIALPFFISGLLFLLLSLQGGDKSFLEYLPLARELRNPSRMLSMVVFALAILSGLGLSTVDVRRLNLRDTSSMRLLPVVVTMFVVADLLAVAWTPLRALFRSPPQVVEGLGREFFQTSLPERQPSNGYPTVAARKGAKDFCPAVLQAFRPQRAVRAREDLSYRGEVYTLGTAQLSDVTITPNVITTRIEAKSADTVVVNQNFAWGWTALPYIVRNEGGLIGVDVPAGSSNLTLRYRTPYLRTGAAISLATTFILGALWIRQRRRRPAA